jgi:hypothetical protein
MREIFSQINKKTIIALLLVGIGLVSIPVGLQLTQQQQRLDSKASESSYTAELREWAQGIVLHPCIGIEFASLHNGRMPSSVEELDAWGNSTNRRINDDTDDPNAPRQYRWECLALSEGTNRGWRDRGHEDLYNHLTAVEQTFQQIMCRRPSREEWAHFGYGRNIAISTLRAELAASEEGMTRARA